MSWVLRSLRPEVGQYGRRGWMEGVSGWLGKLVVLGMSSVWGNDLPISFE